MQRLTCAIVSRSSSVCGPIPNDDCIVIFRSFFDGGKQPDSQQYDVLSLASVSGTTEQWKHFENGWKQALTKHRAKWLHTTDAVSLKKDPFTKVNGWDKTRRDLFLSDCVTVIEKHMAVDGGRPGLIPYVITIVLKDFIDFAVNNPDQISNDVTEVCAAQAVDRVIRQGARIGAHFFCLVFDQNEPFMGHISQRQTNRRAQKHLKPATQRITSIIETDMRVTPALQAADLFAWCFSHKQSGSLHEWQKRLLSHREWIDDWYDKERLTQYVKLDYYTEVKSWKLPPRRPTR